MEDIYVKYSDKKAIETLSLTIRQYIKRNKNKEIIVINIGTDKCIGDTLAPLTGTILTDNNCKIPVYGTLKNPIHAVNLEHKIKELKTKHPDALIIAIDACLGREEYIGDIQIRERPVHPGAGVGKKLPEVGDISIVGIVDDIDNSDLFSIKNIRLDFIMDMAKIISSSIIQATKKYNKNYKEVAICNL